MMLFPACILTFRSKLRNLMDQLDSYIEPSGYILRKFSEPRPFAPPSLALFGIANSFIFECSLPYTPLRPRILLYFLSSLLVMALPSSCLHYYIRVFIYD